MTPTLWSCYKFLITKYRNTSKLLYFKNEPSKSNLVLYFYEP